MPAGHRLRRHHHVLERQHVQVRVGRQAVRIVLPKGGRTSFEGLCVDNVTGAETPGTLGRVTETVTWKALKVVDATRTVSRCGWKARSCS